MLFNSLEFLIFFTLTTVLYFSLPRRFQRYFLLLSSVVFYSFYIPWHVLVLLAVVILNFFYGRLSENSIERSRKYFFIVILSINIAFLLVFKYLNFLNSNIHAFAQLIGWNYSISTLELVLPLGISFYIFKCISYDVEVYRTSIKPERDLSVFMLYVIIYPELLAGPIDRPQNILVQLKQTYDFDYKRITNGLKLMAWGYFQKWVIADRLALLVNTVYNNSHQYNGLSFVIATFFFAVQIYCDFSAYSDIAIGAGQVLGFNFMKNFNRPYFAKSISEFWRRWHISLSTWLRDYLFLPIAYSTGRKLNNSRFLGVKADVWSYTVATLSTMFLAGLWHGAQWTFVIWGTLMGVYMVFSVFTRKLRKNLLKVTRLRNLKKLHSTLAMFFTFSLICFSWIFFKANSFDDAVYIVTHIYTGFGSYFRLLFSSITNLKFGHDLIDPFTLGFNDMELYLAVIFISILAVVNIFQSKRSILLFVSERPLFIRWALYLIFIFIIMIYGRFETRQFIYMQF